jgi:K+-sensing histidine kinase KdpD
VNVLRADKLEVPFMILHGELDPGADPAAAAAFMAEGRGLVPKLRGLTGRRSLRADRRHARDVHERDHGIHHAAKSKSSAGKFGFTTSYVRRRDNSHSVTTTVALALLVIVLLVAAYGRLWMAMTAAVAAMFVFNFFFLPPVGRLTIAGPENWVAFLAFISAALIVSQLSSAVGAGARAKPWQAGINWNSFSRKLTSPRRSSHR